MLETPRYSLLILLCLMKVGEIRAQCERPSVGGNRILTEDSSKVLAFPGGTTLTYKCSTGYEPVQSGSLKTITCNLNQWTDLALQCKQKSCGSPGELTNGGYLTPNGTVFGATATAVCDKGFIINGPTTRNCRDFGWDGRAAVCEVVKCKPPSKIENGQFDRMDEIFSYDDLVTYTCNRDYTLFGEPTIACSANGTFPPPPRCSLVRCENPDIKNANRVEGLRPPYRYTNSVRYECDKGYIMKGSGRLVCGENGWTPDLPTCNKPEPEPSPIPGTQSPPEDNKKKIGIGIGVALLLAAVLGAAAAVFCKKRGHWGKVPTRNEV